MQQPRPESAPRGALVYVAARVPEESAMICAILRNLSGVYAARTFADTDALLRRCRAAPPDTCIIPADVFAAGDAPSALRDAVPHIRIVVLGGKPGEYKDAAGILPVFSASLHQQTRFVIAAETLFTALGSAEPQPSAQLPSAPDTTKSKNALRTLLNRTESRHVAEPSVDISEKAAITGADMSRLRFTMPVHAIAIGSSTGGPDVLNTIFAGLKGIALRCPVFLTQHMPEHFTGMLAERIAKAGNMRCKEGEDGEIAKPGVIYVAPGNYHMRVRQEDGANVIRLDQEPKVNFCRPAVDPMMRSVASCYGGRVLGAVLTGMGNDGAAGAQALKEKGAKIVIQDEAGSAVWGMPGAVYANGAYDEILTPAGVASAIAAANHTPLS